MISILTWQAPSAMRAFLPLAISRLLGGCSAAARSICWALPGESLTEKKGGQQLCKTFDVMQINPSDLSTVKQHAKLTN